MGVIIIIAVFWLLGLLMAWSMCVVAARADRRMEEIRHARHGRPRQPPVIGHRRSRHGSGDGLVRARPPAAP